MSNEYREKENLKQRERDAQRHSSTEFRQQKKLNQGSISQKSVHPLNSDIRKM